MKRIKQLRKENAVKQVDLAKHLGVAQNTLSYWENGKYEPDIEAIIKIASYFNVSTDYLLGLSNSHWPQNIQNPDIFEDFLAIAKKTEGMSVQMRKRICDLLDSTMDSVLAALDYEKEEKP